MHNHSQSKTKLLNMNMHVTFMNMHVLFLNNIKYESFTEKINKMLQYTKSITTNLRNACFFVHNRTRILHKFLCKQL